VLDPTTTAVDPARLRGLTDRLRAVLGVDVGYADEPEPLDTSFGDPAVGFRLDGDGDVPERWRPPLVARWGTRASVSAEVAALQLVQQANDDRLHGPDVLDSWVLDDDGPDAASVTARPTGAGLLELLTVDPGRTSELLSQFGAVQAALHDVKLPPELVDGSIRRVANAADELDADDRIGSVHAKALTWLRDRQPEPGEPVLCHGAYQPGLVTGDPAIGEPLIVRGWRDAVLAEPEYDVAFSTMAFWAAPYYTATRSERAGMKMIRDMLTNVYRGGYEHERPFDDGRVRFWQVFHVLRASVDPSAPADLGPALAKHLKKLTR
jgi:hypothetical protein